VNDIRVCIKFKNNLLYKRIFEKYSSVAHFCKKTNLNPVEVGKYLNFKTSPISRRSYCSNICIGGAWIKEYAIKIANALDCSLLEIFPEQIWGLIHKEYNIEIDSTILIRYNENMAIEEEPQNFKGLYEALSMLTQKEEEVLRMRFGLDGEIMTNEKIGRFFNLSGVRISQIEGKALRKMRHPKNRRLPCPAN